VETALYRITQEALTNARKYGGEINPAPGRGTQITAVHPTDRATSQRAS
jgi:hypothetical protein